RPLLEATVGRRLLIRIWIHGVLLFTGVIVTVVVGRNEMSEIDVAHALRKSPYLALAAGERALAVAADRAALDREVRAIEAGTPLHIAVFGPDGALLSSSVDPPAPPTTAECTTPAPPVWRRLRLVV